MNGAASKTHLGSSSEDATAFDNRALAPTNLDLTQKPRMDLQRAIDLGFSRGISLRISVAMYELRIYDSSTPKVKARDSVALLDGLSG